jgi:hypothetical protein
LSKTTETSTSTADIDTGAEHSIEAEKTVEEISLSDSVKVQEEPEENDGTGSDCVVQSSAEEEEEETSSSDSVEGEGRSFEEDDDNDHEQPMSLKMPNEEESTKENTVKEFPSAAPMEKEKELELDEPYPSKRQQDPPKKDVLTNDNKHQMDASATASHDEDVSMVDDKDEMDTSAPIPRGESTGEDPSEQQQASETDETKTENAENSEGDETGNEHNVQQNSSLSTQAPMQKEEDEVMDLDEEIQMPSLEEESDSRVETEQQGSEAPIQSEEEPEQSIPAGEGAAEETLEGGQPSVFAMDAPVQPETNLDEEKEPDHLTLTSTTVGEEIIDSNSNDDDDDGDAKDISPEIPCYPVEPHYLWGKRRSNRLPDLDLLYLVFQDYVNKLSDEIGGDLKHLDRDSIMSDKGYTADVSPDSVTSHVLNNTDKLDHDTSAINSDFVEGLDDIDKFFEGVDPPDELDVGASGMSIQELVMSKGRQILLKKIQSSFEVIRKTWISLCQHLQLCDDEDDVDMDEVWQMEASEFFGSFEPDSEVRI